MSKFLPIILLVLGLIVGIFLIQNKTFLRSKAAPLTAPQNIVISNITDNSFTVSWTTAEAAAGFISYGKETSLGSAAQDDRDGLNRNKRYTHHVTLSNLDPQITYYFKIGSGSQMFDDKGKLFKQVTAPTVDTTPIISDMATGEISGATDPSDNLIYLRINNGSLLSSFTRKNNWLITLNNSRTSDLKNYLDFRSDMKVDVVIQVGNGKRISKNMLISELVRGFDYDVSRGK